MVKLLRRVKLRLRLLSGFGIVCALLIAMTGVGVLGAVEQARLTKQVGRLQVLTRDVMQLKFRDAQIGSWQVAYAWDVQSIGGTEATSDGSPNRHGFLQSIKALNSEFSAVQVDLLSAAEAGWFQQIKDNFAVFMDTDGKVVAQFRQETPDSTRNGNDLIVGPGYAIYYKILEATNKLLDSVAARADAAEAKARNNALRSTALLCSGCLLALLLAIAISLLITRSIVAPVRNIVEVLRAVAGGDLSRRVAVNTRDELNYVATVLNETLAKTETATGRLAHQATRDTLTELPNRAAVLDRLESAIARNAAHTSSLLAALFIDLDRFKLVNDSLGHDAGDAVLRAVARRLSSVTRESDMVARLAGDEFVVIYEDISNTGDAVAAAERIVAEVSQPIEITVDGARREVTIGASVGIAFVTGQTTISAQDLLRDADVAMYRAKQRGRSRVEIFDQSLSEAIEHKARIQHELRRAIDLDEICVYYQPIVDINTERVIGFEALARWRHPTRGLLPPDEFIPIAEDSGLIVPLGAHVLLAACRQAALWRATRGGCEDLQISVNVSGAQFAHPTFIPTVASALEMTNLDPGALCLEITETTMHADIDATTVTLGALRGLGVHLALDDFGTGYSSLTYLRKFPVQVMKIDRSFVGGRGRDSEDNAIIEMLLSLARTFGLLAIAEGVETRAQVEELRRLGCTTCQGHYFGPPVPAQDAWQRSEMRMIEHE